MPDALVALGGNVGDARNTIARAIDLFCNGQDVVLTARSSDYKTPPWGVTEQPPFINACVAIATNLTPRELLTRAQEVEAALGRDRKNEQRWGPRAIDIDLLTYGDVVLDEPGLTLPHPRLFERSFVLVPLAEIAPDRVIGGVRIREAVAKVDIKGIERLSG